MVCSPVLDGEDDLQMAAVNIWNKHWFTADKGWSSITGEGGHSIIQTLKVSVTELTYRQWDWILSTM
jgi:hypothetical protein